jgi:uncharacterized SAM-dependent methyltransferase
MTNVMLVFSNLVQIVCSWHSHDWRSCLMQIETLSAMIDAIARKCGAKTVVDVGSGQVYISSAVLLLEKALQLYTA